ncbi:MAG: sulfite exporter TauE/SafE family protein [Candidatus Rokubacteria bacterium]|nr:sulfite exporter TauE/SafE family protein [Candidatus Rokubacteria bacterium]
MDVLIELVLGFVLGFLIGLTGVGGGALAAPVLYVVLGLDYAESVALSLLYSLFTKLFSAVQHSRQHSVLWPVTLLYGLTGIPGAVLGSWVVYWASSAVQRTFPFIMGGVLMTVSLFIVLEGALRSLPMRPVPISPHHITWRSVLGVALFQLFVGVLMGITSIGAGSLIILSMIYFFRMSAREIVGSNIVIALIMVAPASLTHYASAGVDWRLLGVLTVGSLGGAILGSKLTLVMPERGLKLVIAVLILVGAVATIAKAW